MVRVYTRAGIPGRIFMTRAWVVTSSGRPVEMPLDPGTSQREAEALADLTAAERQKAIVEGREEAKRKPDLTVRALLKRYHGWLEAQERSSKTIDDKDRCRKFWESVIGDRKVSEIRKADASEIAAAARKRGGHTVRWERKRLEYYRAAVRWGWEDADLFDVNPLKGLRLPEYSPDTSGLVYTPAEALKLATPHEDVDWRVTLAASIICDTGRRISAVLQIRTDDVMEDDGRRFIVFRKTFDKRKRSAIMPVSAETAKLIVAALERPEVYESGCLLPEGRLEYDDATDQPLNKDAITEQLHRAEGKLKIPVIPGRGWHGLKRRHVTTSWEVSGGDVGLIGDLTGNRDGKLLQHTYRQQDRRRMAKHVDGVRKQLTEDAKTS